MLHTLLFIFGSMSIGYILHVIMYWREMHATVTCINSVLTGAQLLLILAVVGLVLSFM